MSAIPLLFAVALAIWHVTNYAAMERKIPVRVGIATAATWYAAGLWPGGLLALLMFAGCWMLPKARTRWVPPQYAAELEAGANLGFASAVLILVVHFDLQEQTGLSSIVTNPKLCAAYLIAGSLLLFAARGGSIIVRGILDRSGAMPLETGQKAEEQREAMNHGRFIGIAERLIVVLFVSNDQFTALAFFFAAKGMIRSKDLERREWADYLILGSLASFLVAVAVGLLVREAFRLAAPAEQHL